MFGFKKKTPKTNDSPSLFGRLSKGLAKTRHGITDSLGSLLQGGQKVDADLLEELETLLLTADVGVETTLRIIDDLSERIRKNKITDSTSLFTSLREDMSAILNKSDHELAIDATKSPFVILMVGVNGVGKTTTIGKLARQFKDQGKSVMLAAGDTFRAAAVEQLQTWGERNDIPVIAQGSGADSASVVFDALQSARSKNIDILIADTAGRLHTQSNLMDELKKVKRVLGKLDDSAPHEVMLVLDAGTGQNALTQAKEFHQAVGVTGITLTKLDGTAKGGIIFAIADKLGIPVRFIGVGEAIEDLQPFHADVFVDALFEHNE
ncbi:MAG: signal recognition particle-docking protein FtsY [Gammaproteobacteria bacterium]|nr:signal recognition particle-docking protein FtsY [Gammaproteobacteria bacterium]